MIKIGWAIIFKKGNVDEDWADEYLNSEPGTRIFKKEEMTLPVSNSKTGIDVDTPVIVYLMDTDGIVIPPRFRFELNLKAALDNKYIFFPVEREES